MQGITKTPLHISAEHILVMHASVELPSISLNIPNIPVQISRHKAKLLVLDDMISLSQAKN